MKCLGIHFQFAVLENYGLQGVLIEITFIELVNAFVLRDALADPCPLVSLFWVF